MIIPIDFHIFQRGSNHQPVLNITKQRQFGDTPRGLDSSILLQLARRGEAAPAARLQWSGRGFFVGANA